MMNDKPPEHWADCPLAELESAIRAIATWTERDGELVDFAFVARTMHVVGRTRAGSQDEATALSELVRRTAHDTVRAELDALDRPYFTRWRLLSEMLETFALHLDVPDSVLGRKHVVPILLALHERGGRVPQGELGDLIANEGQRSATLKFMESWDLVERSPGPTGNARIVELTDLGRLAIADRLPAAASTSGTRIKRGIEYMSGRATA